MRRTFRKSGKGKGSKRKGGEQSISSKIRELINLSNLFRPQVADLDFVLTNLECNKTNNCVLEPEYKDWVAHRNDGEEILQNVDTFSKFHKFELVNDKLKYNVESMQMQGEESKLDDLLNKVKIFKFDNFKNKFEILRRDTVAACAYNSKYGSSTTCFSLPSQQKESTWWKSLNLFRTPKTILTPAAPPPPTPQPPFASLPLLPPRRSSPLSPQPPMLQPPLHEGQAGLLSTIERSPLPPRQPRPPPRCKNFETNEWISCPEWSNSEGGRTTRRMKKGR